MNAIIRRSLRKGLDVCKPLITSTFRQTNLDLKGIEWRLRVHSFPSAIAVIREGNCNDRLLDLSCRLINRTRHTTVNALKERGAPNWAARWPGEHYRLLAALVEELRPRTVVEIGTFTGLGTVALLEQLPPEGQLTTFDVIPWNRILESQSGPDREDTYLKAEDFSSGRLTQVIADAGDPQIAQRHAALFQRADLIFVDGPKDGVFERRFLENCAALSLRPGTILVFDDIRLLNMIDIWAGITHPKLDFTGFGHFTGTGLVEWSSTA